MELVKEVVFDFLLYIWELLSSKNIFLRVSSWIIFISNFLTIIIIVIVFINRLVRTRKINKKKKVRRELDDLMSLVIYEDYPLDSEEWKKKRTELVYDLKRRFKSRYQRGLLRVYLVNLQKNFSGNSSEIIRDLFLQLNFDKDSLRLLSHPDWSRRCQGLIEIAAMKLTPPKKTMDRLLDDQNLVIAMEAEVAQLQVEPHDKFRFLDEAEIEMSGWHQIRLLHVLKQMKPEEVPDFSRWLHHPLDSVKIFSLRMILEFNQFEFIKEADALLKSKNEQVIIELVKVLQGLNISDFNKDLMHLYSRASIHLKLIILESFSVIFDDELIDFLKEEFFNSNFDISKAAALALATIGPEGLIFIESQHKMLNAFQQAILKDVKDELLHAE